MNRHRIALFVAVLLVAAASFAPIVPAAGSNVDAVAPPVPPVQIKGLAGLEQTVDLNFRNTRLATVLDTLGRRAGFDVSIGSKIPDDRISLRLDGVTVGRALAIVAQRAGLAYSAPKPGSLLVERSGPLVAGIGDVTSPKLILESKVDPVYPESMRAEGIGGHVILQAVIDETGDVGQLEVLRSEPQDRADLIASALDAVGQWRYEPATLDGKPVEVYFTVYIDYTLSDKEDAAR